MLITKESSMRTATGHHTTNYAYPATINKFIPIFIMQECHPDLNIPDSVRLENISTVCFNLSHNYLRTYGFFPDYLFLNKSEYSLIEQGKDILGDSNYVHGRVNPETSSPEI